LANKSDIVVIIFWIGLSLFVLTFSFKLGLGNLRDPGPGFMPFLLGVVLFIICCFLLLKLLLKVYKRSEIVKEDHGHIYFWRIGLVLVSLYAYALLLETMGYLIATFILLSILFRSAGSKKWVVLLVSSAVTVLITFFAFTYLGLRFPMGILKWR